MPFQPAAPTSPITLPVTRAWRGVSKNSSSPPTRLDDLRRYGHECERSDDVGNLVVERHWFEDVPEKAGPVQQGAEHDQAEDPPPRHLAGPLIVKCFHTTKST